MPQNSKTLNDVTESDLIKALQDALENIDKENERNTITIGEYVEATGLSDYKARQQLDELCDNGVLEREYISRINAWKVKQKIPGYRYVGDASDAT